MAQAPHTSLTDDALDRLLDGAVEGHERLLLHERLMHDPDAQARLQAWEHQRAALRSLHVDVLDEAIPPALLQAATGRQGPPRPASIGSRWGGLAASVVLAFAAGWVSHGT